MCEDNRLYKWICKNGEYYISEPINRFIFKTKKSNEVLIVNEKNIVHCYPDNVTTVWKLERDYGISKQKTSKAIREGRLNAFMLGMKNFYLLKWFIENDKLLEKYIKSNTK